MCQAGSVAARQDGGDARSMSPAAALVLDHIAAALIDAQRKYPPLLRNVTGAWMRGGPDRRVPLPEAAQDLPPSLEGALCAH